MNILRVYFVLEFYVDMEYAQAMEKYTEAINMFPTAILYGTLLYWLLTLSQSFHLPSEVGTLRSSHSGCNESY